MAVYLFRYWLGRIDRNNKLGWNHHSTHGLTKIARPSWSRTLLGVLSEGEHLGPYHYEFATLPLPVLSIGTNPSRGGKCREDSSVVLNFPVPGGDLTKE